jgi:1,2-diacylglycerol 3-beta-glucosyltransferase
VRNRIVLIGLIFAVWVGLKLLDNFVTGPEVLIFTSLFLIGTTFYCSWLLAAQRRWRRRYRQVPLAATVAASHSGPDPLTLPKEPELPEEEKAEEARENAWHPVVDIFIAAKNEARVIENTVRNLFKIDYDRFSIWVIDDCSSDNSKEILQRLQTEYSNLKVVQRALGSYPGKSAALNEALPLSKGEVIVVFDADAYVAPNFLKDVLPILAQDGIAAVQVQKRIYEHQKGFLVNCQASAYALDTFFQIGRDTIGGAVELRGNGEVIKRAALVDVGGWNNRSVTDDLDLSMRFLINHWDIRFCPNDWVWEEGVETVKGLMRQRRRWAEGAIRRYLDYIFPLNSPTRLSLVERIDTLAFTVYFAVPALLLFEMTSELFRLLTGTQTHGMLFGLIFLASFLVSGVNLFAAIRYYRSNMPFWYSLWHSFAVNVYVWLHWVPCIVIALCQIMFRKQASTWHRTEHVGQWHANS